MTARVNYKELWDGLISALCCEVVRIENQPEKTVEDFWVEGTLYQVLSKMCAAHRLPHKLQKPRKLTQNLFE